METNATDQGWQELQARIEQLHRKYFGGSLHAIEYKPGEVVQLLEMPRSTSEFTGQ